MSVYLGGFGSGRGSRVPGLAWRMALAGGRCVPARMSCSVGAVGWAGRVRGSEARSMTLSLITIGGELEPERGGARHPPMLN